jgi:hypothetical protein
MWTRTAIFAVGLVFASTAIGGTDQAEAITGTGPGTISVGAVTYGYVDFAPRGNAIWTTAGPVSHLFEAAWHYRVSGDTREFSISGTPDDTDYSGDTISVSYNDVGTRGLLRAVYSDQLQSPSPSGGAAVRSVLTLTNISAVSQTVTAFRYVDVDLADTTGGDSAVAIGGGGNHVRINDGSNTLDLVGDNATYRVAAFDTLGTALNDLVVDSFANSGLPFAAGDITLGLQWNAVSIAPGASVSFTVNMDLNTPDTENGGPGEDGDQTFTAADVVVNSYSALTGQSGSTLTVSNAADLTLPGAACPNTSGGCLDATSRALQRGDLLLVYQPQGATLDTASNSVGYGTVSNYNGAGRYEFVYVQSVAGNVITIADSDSGGSICGGGLRFTYAVPGTMVIRVPQYSNLTVNAGASLVAPAWTGSSGGVVAIHVGGSPVPSTGVATVNGAIHADARGFRGGVVAEQTVVFDVTSFVCANPDGAQKGEGIGDGIYNSVDNRCRGAAANGGGGGNNHNSGGGGGANGGFDAADPAAGGWLRGIGVYAPGPGGSGPGSPFDFLLSWALDGEIDPDLGGPNLPQTSRGGGRGGYTYAASRANPQIAGPGDAAWGGDLRRIAGGLGGRPLNGLPSGGDPYRRLYFGGGGGAGESNNSQGGSGGAGGGLAFLIARRVQGTGQIRADGAAGQNTAGGGNNDAPGGGGGGGTVVIDAANGVPAGLSVFARGGGGGNQLAIDSESEGPGGGGGGGVILTSGGSTSLAGGVQGSSASGGLRDPADATETRRFPVNGATSGAPGSFAALPPREGAASPYSCLQGPGFTTPVSNAWFRSESLGGHRARVEFAVTAEIGHAGYWVYAESTSGQRQRAGTFIAAAGAGNSLARNYQQVLELPESTRSLYLADVDLHGRETLRGPFDVGGEHGTPPSVIDYDWSASRSQRDVYQSALRGSIGSVARIGVRQRGMQRISYEQLQAAGIALGGVAASDIAVLSRSASVPRRVRGGTVFGPGSSIEFFGEAAPSLWSRDHYYLLLIDGAQAVDMALIDSPVAPAPLSSYQALVEYAPQNAYNEASPSGDPWYADRVVANGAAAARSIVLSGPVPASATGELEVVLWGGIDWPGNKPDHHVELYFNGQQVASERFDGVAQSVLRVPVTLASGNATVEVRLPRNTGFVADIVHIESIRLRYPALAQANGQRFLGASMQGTAWDSIYADAFGDPLPAVRGGVVTVGGSAGPMRRAYRIEGGSAVEYVIPDSDPVALDSVGFRPSSELWIGAQNQMLTPALSLIAAPNGLFGSATDWLVISHGAFAPALQPLLARRASQGLSTRLVEVSAIYARYSAGNPDPAAIRSYIAAARANMGVRYVLLVGADTTDAPGYLNSGSVSFIPAPYASTSSFVRYAPADPLLADGDGDGVPDLALGRLPVRTLVEAEEAVRKILDYETQPVSGQFLVAAGPQDSSAPQPFRVAAEEFAVELSQSWNIDRVYQDLLGLGGARQALVAAFNNGRSVVSYIGHSGPTRWTFDPLLDVSQVLGSSSNPALPNLLPNTNQPIVLQFACWTTYFVSPTQNTMAQALLLSPGRGASAVLGASVLMEQASHQRMAGALARHLSPGTRIGDALMAAKAELAADADDPAGPEILLGQILLGDPAQQIR